MSVPPDLFAGLDPSDERTRQLLNRLNLLLDGECWRCEGERRRLVYRRERYGEMVKAVGKLRFIEARCLRLYGKGMARYREWLDATHTRNALRARVAEFEEKLGISRDEVGL